MAKAAANLAQIQVEADAALKRDTRFLDKLTADLDDPHSPTGAATGVNFLLGENWRAYEHGPYSRRCKPRRRPTVRFDVFHNGAAAPPAIGSRRGKRRRRREGLPS